MKGAAEWPFSGSVRVVTRRSPLAKRQTELTLDWLQSRVPEARFDVEEMVTTGDQQLQWSLQERGGKGLFTKELETALLSGDADIAVHSAKDLPTDLPDGLALAGYLPRGDVIDVFVVQDGCRQPSMIATGSPRRRQQAKPYYPNAVWTEIRGNVATRLRKVAAGEVDGTFLAMAGLRRLDIMAAEGVVFKPLDIRQMVPAVGQGAIALQVRAEDAERVRTFLCEETWRAVSVERAFLHLLGGGCHTAVGAHFCNGILHVFHERTGRFCIDLRAEQSSRWLDVLQAEAASRGLIGESRDG